MNNDENLDEFSHTDNDLLNANSDMWSENRGKTVINISENDPNIKKAINLDNVDLNADIVDLEQNTSFKFNHLGLIMFLILALSIVVGLIVVLIIFVF